MSKIYAVKKGYIPGIYRSWNECKKQVNGFSGAVYKSFNNEKDAKKFIEKITDETVEKQSKSINIYTDGSHQPTKNYLGLGAFCEYEGEEFELSATCDSEFLKSYGILNSNCSNPTSEFLGFAEVLRQFENTGIKNVTLNFYIDYIGVKHWMENTWRTKEVYITRIKEECNKIIHNLQCDIIIHHIPGHSGIYGNDRADILAKSNITHNNFNLLCKKFI